MIKRDCERVSTMTKKEQAAKLAKEIIQNGQKYHLPVKKKIKK
jgi:hypothetical protein